ncbi:MAG TPA: Imm52 family immunity protein [Stellaceae bacterium]|nr:Imm52 family immunity protein [Stellaceae bacterium]
MGYEIRAFWGPRRETAAQCGARFWRMLEALAAIDPAFGGWKFAGRTRFWPMPEAPGEELTRLIADCISRDNDDEPDPAHGFWFGAGTRPGSKTSLTIQICAGDYTPSVTKLINSAELLTKPLNEDNAALITLPVFKPALLAIAAAWDATWCAAYPWDILPFWAEPGPGQPHFRMAWITYLSPRFAPMVTPPRSAIVERTPQSGLVMIATEDRFDVTNPAHLAVAREIEAALAPVNALPWPPGAEPAPAGSRSG